MERRWGTVPFFVAVLCPPAIAEPSESQVREWWARVAAADVSADRLRGWEFTLVIDPGDPLTPGEVSRLREEVSQRPDHPWQLHLYRAARLQQGVRDVQTYEVSIFDRDQWVIESSMPVFGSLAADEKSPIYSTGIAVSDGDEGTRLTAGGDAESWLVHSGAKELASDLSVVRPAMLMLLAAGVFDVFRGGKMTRIDARDAGFTFDVECAIGTVSLDGKWVSGVPAVWRIRTPETESRSTPTPAAEIRLDDHAAVPGFAFLVPREVSYLDRRGRRTRVYRLAHVGRIDDSAGLPQLVVSNQEGADATATVEALGRVFSGVHIVDRRPTAADASGAGLLGPVRDEDLPVQAVEEREDRSGRRAAVIACLAASLIVVALWMGRKAVSSRLTG